MRSALSSIEEVQAIQLSSYADIYTLVFKPGESAQSLGLAGDEIFHIGGIENMTPRKVLPVTAVRPDGNRIEFEVITRLDTEVDVDYFNNGGILPYVLRKLMR